MDSQDLNLQLLNLYRTLFKFDQQIANLQTRRQTIEASIVSLEELINDRRNKGVAEPVKDYSAGPDSRGFEGNLGKDCSS